MPPKTRGVVAKKPPSLLWKPLKIDGWGLFTGIAKCGKSLWGGEYEKALEEAVKAVGCIKFKDKTDGELAWALVYAAMTRALGTQLREIRMQLPEAARERFIAKAAEADRALEAANLTLDQSFFDHPDWSPYVRAVARQNRHWLIALGVDEGVAERSSRLLLTEFTYALEHEWQANKDLFSKLLPDKRTTPFTPATLQMEYWARYALWLDDEADRRVFDEDFGLTAVYVPLRAYVEVPGEGRTRKRIVGRAEDMIDAWMEKGRSNDAVRVVEGDPGAGKSSLARRFAATRFGRTIGEQRWRVVYLPLHDEAFVTGRSIEEAAAGYTMRVAAEELSPLERDSPDGTLLILDGLDELSRGGQFGRDVIRAFMSQVTALLKAWNDRDAARLLVLICGRPVAVGEIKAEVRADGAVLNLLPFLVSNVSVPDLFNFSGDREYPQGLLAADQREEWYAMYATARGQTDGDVLYAMIKDHSDLDPVTAQPLLNYLVAFLIRETGGELPGNLCGVYETLLRKVWQRGWDRSQVPAIEKLDFEPFCQLLETIALAAWHSSNTRSIRVGEVEDRLTAEQKEQLTTFEKEVKAGVLRLLFAFFLRPGAVDRGDQTYEFTHKTFAEYLVARRLVREIDTLAADWKKGGRAWKDEDRLKDWAELFGPTALDDDLHDFLVSALQAEVEQRNQRSVGSGMKVAENWQAALAQLLNVAVRDGMPMHAMTAKLKPHPTFQEMNRQALNSELALLHTLNACSGLTRERSRIPALEASPQDWMGGRWHRAMLQSYYRFLSLEKVDWFGRHLRGINLSNADLSEANLSNVYLDNADMGEANLSNADLSGTDLDGADLHEADLSEANLSGAYLGGANLSGAYLGGANLRGGDLRGAYLSGADLHEADLSEANLSGANLSEANLSKAVGVTDEQLRVTTGEPAFMPDGKPPKKNWRSTKPRNRKKASKPTPKADAPNTDSSNTNANPPAPPTVG